MENFYKNILLLFFCVLFLNTSYLLFAQNSNSSAALNNAAVEQQERELKVSYLLTKANNNFFQKKYKIAANQYLEALSLLSKTSTASKINRKKISEIKNSLALVYTNWAEENLYNAQLASENGNLNKALKLTKEAAEINPKLNVKAKELIKKINEKKQSNKFNYLTTDKANEKLDNSKNFNVSILFEQGKILLQNNKLDQAKNKFDEILSFDPYNSKAIHYLNVINQKIYRDGKARKSQTSAQRIAEVGWTSVLPITSKNLTGERIDLNSTKKARISKYDAETMLEQKLNDIIIPHISFDDVPVSDALLFLKEESKKLDPTEKGINLILELPPSLNRTNQYNVTLTESNVPLRTSLEHICKDAGVYFAVKKYAVHVSNKNISSNQLVTKVFAADREKFGSLLIDSDVTPSIAVDLKEYFKNRDIEFGSGASIIFDMRISRIIARNTPEEIIKIKEILDKLDKTVTPQVSIASKFIEVSQNDFDELGFEWSISPNPSSNITLPDISSATRNAESILGTKDNYFNFSVNHNNWDVGAILHALSQSSSTEALSSPRVTTLNGYTTVIRVVTERYFPDSWSEPKLVTTTANDQESQWLISSIPTFGSATDIGIVLKVTPFVASDNYSVDLILEPIIQTFIRWNEDYTYYYNYTMNINGKEVNKSEPYTQKMPIIGSRAIKTRLRIYDGDTVVMGGALNDKTTKYNDKIPIIGDMPLVGRFFQSEIEQVIKTNLLIFTTVRLVMPDGSLLRPAKEDGRANFPDKF